MKEFLQVLIDLFDSLNYAEIAGYLAGMSAGISLLWKLGAKLHKLRQQRTLRKDLHPYYSKEEIQRHTQYYVQTKCQNIAPAKEEEPKRTHAFATREKIIPFFLKKAFKNDDRQFYIVLGDSGMGKTTFLINLYLRYIEQFFGAKYQIKLFPLGFPGIDEELAKIPDDERRQTILLLDAFDEDIQAVHDYKTRMNDLIHMVLHFREVVITCRTQFFPSEEEEPKETGVLRYSGDGGDRVFRKLYISPFDDRDVRRYLRKRFGWLRVFTKRKTKQIVKHSPNLMARPMLLSYIEDLLESNRPYTAAYMVYEVLIDRWIAREADKVDSSKRERYQKELYPFSRAIALDIYRQREKRGGALLIPGDEIAPFAEEYGIDLDEMEMKSRSLLNRNARGDYKFSHRSVLEYFLAVEAFTDPAFRREMDFDGMEQARAFFNELVWEKLTDPNKVRGGYSLIIPGIFLSEEDYRDIEYKDLATLNVTMLPEVTALRLKFDIYGTGVDVDDLLLYLKGLKNLDCLDITGIQNYRELRNDLKRLLSGRWICIMSSDLLRRTSLAVPYEKHREKFGLDAQDRPLGYIQNDFEDQGEIVLDHTNDLMWQKSGSNDLLTYEQVQEYIEMLNQKQFGGYSNWRLPTIPELTSLLEREEQPNGLYISAVFDARQILCWSADKRQTKGKHSSEGAWLVDFKSGIVYWRDLDCYVRCVRS
ncbi:DUF1566 domain-containing protein [candidate division KSB3 bacterium]|uniref:DUF1566 domain-containing protein n=1 Tax=candidate division KSB3 bacterium TaxID=2044937 RepID=A0A9D5K045_9BACT|nr:DUF1566 domain-containing protein [candidate division KSB3 bacterium]MBD3326947.1 DUF1566 domain-containing protein [candidate division KSB3 bacterium]